MTGKYIRTPAIRKKLSESKEGEKNPMWKGGRLIDKEGYVLILKKDHPYCNNMGYVREHRLIIEDVIGRFLNPKEVTHHLGQRADNRPHKLMVFVNHSAHMRFEYGSEIKSKEIIYDGRNHESN